MKKTWNFAKRSFKEIIRDPLSVVFTLALPLFLLFIFQQFNISSPAYSIENFTPGVLVFSFSFLTMFTATLVARDRGTSLLVRLGVSPMRGVEFVCGYLLAVLPIVVMQDILFFALALLLKLPLSLGVFYTVLASFPVSVLFILLGVLLGSVTSEHASAGVSSGVVQLVAFTSGMYFDGEIVGGFFSVVCKILPFSGAVDILKGTLNGGADLWLPIVTVAAYTLVIGGLTAFVFYNNMKKGK